MDFSNIIGHEKIKKDVLDIIEKNNASHSYMFIGQEGIGKLMLAKEFAKGLLCLSDNKSECNNCDSCIKFTSGNHPDFTIVEPDGNYIKIDQIRDMQDSIYQKPIISSKKVFIINNADKMREEAQNALLKTLEEPPHYIVIILVVSNENLLLNTIKSRCLKIHFSNLSKEEVKLYMKQNNLTKDLTENILDLCNGSIGKFDSMQKDIELYSEIENKFLKFINKKYNSIIDVINDFEFLYKSKDNMPSFLEYMIVIIYNEIKKMQSINTYFKIIKIIEKTRSKLYSNSNYDMTMDELLFKIWDELK